MLRQLADLQTTRKVARYMGLTPKTVWLTSQRYQQGGLDRALYERTRPGKEARLDRQQRQRIDLTLALRRKTDCIHFVCNRPNDFVRRFLGDIHRHVWVSSIFSPAIDGINPGQ